MRTAAPREGRDHDTLLPGPGAVAVIVMLATLAQHAAAQNAPCTAIQDDAERLACYDRALRASSPAPAAPAATAPGAQAPAAQTPATPSAQAPPGQAPPTQAPTAPAAQASTAPAPATTASPATADKNIIPIVIVGVRTLPGRETMFTAQDGTTWVQTDSQRLAGLPDPPFDAELKPGAVGSQFLVPKDGARAIRVRPAQR